MAVLRVVTLPARTAFADVSFGVLVEGQLLPCVLRCRLATVRLLVLRLACLWGEAAASCVRMPRAMPHTVHPLCSFPSSLFAVERLPFSCLHAACGCVGVSCAMLVGGLAVGLPVAAQQCREHVIVGKLSRRLFPLRKCLLVSLPNPAEHLLRSTFFTCSLPASADSRPQVSINKFQMAKVTKEGTTISEPFSLDTKWDHKLFAKPTEWAVGAW